MATAFENDWVAHELRSPIRLTPRNPGRIATQQRQRDLDHPAALSALMSRVAMQEIADALRSRFRLAPKVGGPDLVTLEQGLSRAGRDDCAGYVPVPQIGALNTPTGI